MLVSCVWWGDKYPAEYVYRLRNAVRDNLPVPHRFVCFTDRKLDGIETRSTGVDWPGWWQKVALFAAPERQLYFDLDVIVTGDLTPFAEPQEFTIIRDWLGGRFNSSVMLIDGNREVFDRFRPEHMERFRGGDQDWIHAQMPNAATWDEGLVRSYRKHCRDGVPGGCRVVVFHGKPKPHECEGWAGETWKSMTP